MGLDYDRQGNPVTPERWAELVDTEPDVKRTDINGYEISTIWTGCSEQRPPLIFETFAFHTTGDPDYDRVDIVERYATETEAIAGHDRTVDQLAAEAEAGSMARAQVEIILDGAEDHDDITIESISDVVLIHFPGVGSISSYGPRSAEHMERLLNRLRLQLAEQVETRRAGQ